MAISSTLQKTDNVSTEFSPYNELSITSSNFIQWGPSFIDAFSSIVYAIKFKNLFISCSEMPISMLLKIIHLLPNLHSLEISSLSLQKLNNLSDENADNLRLVSKNNKIRKVRQSMDIKITEFLITLCPRIQHFEVSWVTNIDLPRLVGFILMKPLTHIPQLHSLLFNARNGRDEIVDELQQMIDSEKLLSDYIIKRSSDDISLRWKLQ